MTEIQPQVAYSETKLRVLIISISQRKDWKQRDYWIIKVQLDQWKERGYLAFSNSLSGKAQSLLINFKEQLIDKFAWLTIKKKGDREKVVEIELEE